MSAQQTQVPQQAPPQISRAIVKQVLSGDTIVVRGVPKGGPPPERTLSFSLVTAPKLAKRVPNQNNDSQDEPYAWEAREFLRKKLIGQVVQFVVDKPPTSTREYATVYLGNEPNRENIVELMVKEGLVHVRADNVRSPSPELARLVELEEAAKTANKGRFSLGNPQDHVRNIKWSVDNMMNFVDKCGGKPIQAVVEHVRDGSTVRAFLLPDFIYITLMMSGIRCPSHKLDSDGKPDPSVKVEFAEEAKYFTEIRLLQQDVEIVLETINNNNFVGSIHHPKGNIAEELLKAGLAHCVDWSIAKMKKSEADKLKQAEKMAKEKRLRIWKNWTPPPKMGEFSGTVVEVVNGDALMIKLPNSTIKKIFLAGIRPPREQSQPGNEDKQVEGVQRSRVKRPLYDIPWMFEAREFLRKKLIGKKVNVVVDYVQPARDNLPEKTCCTVTISNVNVAEAMVSKGLATVVRYRQNDDQRASAYDSLLSAENKAIKGNKGVHAKKDIPVHRVNDICGDPVKAKNLLPHIMRSSRIEALVEFVVNGSRLRLYLPRDSHLITFLLSGIEVRNLGKDDGPNTEEAALAFTREKCMQKEVEIQVENTDRNGNFIGWLWIDNVNLSVALVEAGLARIHFSGESSKYAKDLNNAKNSAKANGLWKFTEKEEQNDIIEEDKTVERRVDYKKVLVVEVNDLTFSCQYAAQEPKLKALQEKIIQEMAANPPLPGAYVPKKGDTCAAKYPVDDMWYRAKIEKVAGNKVTVVYMDYGNRAEIQSVQCAALPSSFIGDKPYAQQYTLAFVTLPPDVEDKKLAVAQFQQDVKDRQLLLNTEYSDKTTTYVTLCTPDTNEDIGKLLVAEGHVLVAKRREKRFEKIMKEYQEAEDKAKNARLNMWVYGDVREDEDKEFGMGR